MNSVREDIHARNIGEGEINCRYMYIAKTFQPVVLTHTYEIISLSDINMKINANFDLRECYSVCIFESVTHKYMVFISYHCFTSHPTVFKH